jgi:glucosyl-3-phosphoglycerate synthase
LADGGVLSQRQDPAVAGFAAVLRSYGAGDFPAARVLGAKGRSTVSVVIPARDEEATVGSVVEVIRRSLMEEVPVVDELVVVDDGSSDATAAMAAAAGARVLRTDCEPGPGPPQTRGPTAPPGGPPDTRRPTGKGEALWQGVGATAGDVVVFCDADVVNFTPAFVLGLAGPLLVDAGLALVKAAYRRPYRGQPGEGGRVTELVARPALELLFPELSGLRQPLAGECGARREVLEAVPFVGGYGVDVGLIIDVARRCGASAVAQCDLGERVHRNRPLAELAPQARAVMATILSRAGVAMVAPPPRECPPLVQVGGSRHSA